MVEQKGKNWVVIAGTGLAISFPCVVTDIIFYPVNTRLYVDVYDGRDITVGREFARLMVRRQYTTHYKLGDGVLFSSGVYVDSGATNNPITVIFRSCNSEGDDG